MDEATTTRRREGFYPADVLTVGGLLVFGYAAFWLVVEWITANVMEVFHG